jgi:lipopolysaccharide export system permease protein
MRIIDRYITKSIAFVFVITTLMFSLLYVLIDSTSNLDEFLAQKVALPVIAQYYASYLPIVLVQTSAVACLIAVLFCYSNLNNQNEIIALRASGMNFWRISRPAIFFAIFIAGLTFYANEKFAPVAQERAQKIRDEHLILEVDRKKKKVAKIEYLTYYGFKNRLYCIDSYDPNTFEMENITVHEYNDAMQIKEKTLALKGKWTGIAWKFYNVHVSKNSENENEDPQIKVFAEKLMDIKESPQDFLRQSLNVNSMNSRQLHEYISRFSKSGALRAINNLHVDLQEKLAKPFSIIVVVLAGLPLTLMVGRRKAQTFTSLAIAIAIAFLYAIVNSVGIALGKGGFLWPIAAAWLAPVVFSGLAAYLIKTKFT